MVKRFLKDERGATAMEYAMIATLVSVVIIGATLGIGSKLNAKFLGPVLGGLN